MLRNINKELHIIGTKVQQNRNCQVFVSVLLIIICGSDELLCGNFFGEMKQFPNKWFHFVDILVLLRQIFIICGNHILSWITLTLQNISHSFRVCILFCLSNSYQTSLKRMFSLLYCLLCISLVLPLVRNLTSLNFKSLLVQGKGKIMDKHRKHLFCDFFRTAFALVVIAVWGVPPTALHPLRLCLRSSPAPSNCDLTFSNNVGVVLSYLMQLTVSGAQLYNRQTCHW